MVAVGAATGAQPLAGRVAKRLDGKGQNELLLDPLGQVHFLALEAQQICLAIPIGGGAARLRPGSIGEEKPRFDGPGKRGQAAAAHQFNHGVHLGLGLDDPADAPDMDLDVNGPGESGLAIACHLADHGKVVGLAAEGQVQSRFRDVIDLDAHGSNLPGLAEQSRGKEEPPANRPPGVAKTALGI